MNADTSSDDDRKFDNTDHRFKPKRFKFKGQEKTNFSNKPESDFDFLSTIFEDQLMEKIMDWTNRKAAQKRTRKPNSWIVKI